MITYTSQTNITVKVDGRVAGHIKEKVGKGFYYHPKGASKSFRSEYFPTLIALKFNLETA